MPEAFTNRNIESTNDVFDIDISELDKLRLWND